MDRNARRLFAALAALAAAVSAAIPLTSGASTPATSTLTLEHPVHEWDGNAPWPGITGCQPSDPTCDHHLLTIGEDVNPGTWSVAVEVDAADTHVAVYRIDRDSPRVDVIPIGQSVIVNRSTGLTAIAASSQGGRIVFIAQPGSYDIEVAGSGTVAAPEHYRARARLCVSADCQLPTA